MSSYARIDGHSRCIPTPDLPARQPPASTPSDMDYFEPSPARAKRCLDASIMPALPQAKRAKQVIAPPPTDEVSIREQVLKTIVTDAHLPRWDDIAGMDAIKHQLQSLMAAGVLGTARRKRPVLLCGPSGAGKSVLASALAGRLDEIARREEIHPIRRTTVFFVPCAGLYRYVGYAEKFIEALFRTAQQKAPSLIILDDIGSLLNRRDLSSSDTQLRTFTRLLQGIDGCQHDEVHLVATTNEPVDLDDAVARRFHAPMHVGALWPEDCASILASLLARCPTDVTVEEICDIAANHLKNPVAGDVEAVVSAAYDMGPLARLCGASYFVVRDGAIHPSNTWVEGCQAGSIDNVVKGDFEFVDLPITYDDLIAACASLFPTLV